MGVDLPRSLGRTPLAIAAAAAAGSAIAAVVHAPPGVVAWLAALGAFAIAYALAATARALHGSDELREPRHALGPTRLALPDDVTRRGVFGRFWWLAGGAVAILGIVPFVALVRQRTPRGTAWKAGARLVTPAGVPLRANDVAVGGVETVFPEGSVGAPESATLLVRLPGETTTLDPARRDWVPHGNVAYSKICTHAGCPVAIYRERSLELYCPCHQSVFNVVEGGRPVSGPATRALPQLALDVDRDGYLIARGDYTEPVGPDSWDRPA